MSIAPGTRFGAYEISTSGGVEAQWSRSGHELFYLTPDNILTAIQTRAVGINRYDVSADAKPFLINVPVEDRAGRTATVVLNWMQEITRAKR